MTQALPRPCRSLPHALKPFAGESLCGLVSRNLASHAVDRVAAALLVAGIDTLTPERVATTPHRREDGLAALLNVDVAEVRDRMRVGATPSEGTFDFHGCALPSRLVEVERRRVSPRSLAATAYHRDVWNLRPLGFCPESRERLVDTCPACGHALGWRWTLGVELCEGCGEDLRDHPGPTVGSDDEEALDFVVDLVHPLPCRRVAARSLVPAALAGFDNAAVFRSALALADVLRHAREPRAIDQYAPKDVADLAGAGRIVMDWPGGFHRLLERLRRGRSYRVVHAGLKKNHGIPGRLRIGRLLPDAMKPVMSREACHGIVSVKDANISSGISRVALYRLSPNASVPERGPDKVAVLLVSDDLEDMARAKAEAISERDAASLLGVGRRGVGRLAEAGLVEAVEGAVLAAFLGERPVFSRASVEALAKKARLACLRCCLDDETPDLRSAVAGHWSYDPPWDGILKAVIDGSLPVASGRGKGGLTACLVPLDTADVARVLEGLGMRDRSVLGSLDAARLLGTTDVVIGGAVKAGLLSAEGDRRRTFRREDLLAFAAAYVPTPEAARIMGMSRNGARKELARHGIHPAAQVADRLGLWRRSDVTSIACGKPD